VTSAHHSRRCARVCGEGSVRKGQVRQNGGSRYSSSHRASPAAYGSSSSLAWRGCLLRARIAAPALSGSRCCASRDRSGSATVRTLGQRVDVVAARHGRAADVRPVGRWTWDSNLRTLACPQGGGSSRSVLVGVAVGATAHQPIRRCATMADRCARLARLSPWCRACHTVPRSPALGTEGGVA